MMDTPDGAGALNYALRVPKGGYRCHLSLEFALAADDLESRAGAGLRQHVVVKQSEETPATATLLGEVMNSAGIPAGVYNVVHVSVPIPPASFSPEHPGVDAITFTGETVTGSQIMKPRRSACATYRLNWAARMQGWCLPTVIWIRP